MIISVSRRTDIPAFYAKWFINLKVFKELASLVGYDKVIWRYDPIVLSNVTDVEFHINTYEYIAQSLSNYTQRCVLSILDSYSKANKRFKLLEKERNFQLFTLNNNPNMFNELLSKIGKIAKENKLEIFSCAETIDLESYDIKHGKCIDDDYINQIFGKEVTNRKDTAQRKACGCVVSKDIGMYDTCLFGCQYCYATTNFDKSKENNRLHNPESPSLIGWYETPNSQKVRQLELF
jgi:hypothetical protein